METEMPHWKWERLLYKWAQEKRITKAERDSIELSIRKNIEQEWQEGFMRER